MSAAAVAANNRQIYVVNGERCERLGRIAPTSVCGIKTERIQSFAELVYQLDGGIPYPCSESEGEWKVYDAFYPFGNDGIGIACYIHRRSKKLVISIRGTNPNSLEHLQNG